MTRKDFIPGVIFKLPVVPGAKTKSHSLFLYKKQGTIDLIEEVGFGDKIFSRPNGEHNLHVSNRSIYFYTGFGYSCYLMNSPKFSFDEIELVNPETLKAQ